MSIDKAGMIVKGVGGAYTVLADGNFYICNARGVFRNTKTTPLIGDYVIISVTDEDKKIGTLHTIKPRKNELRRPPVANIDQVIVTVATAQPAFNAGLLDRLLALIEYEDIPAVICVNKSDIAKDDRFVPYIQAGYPVIYTSTVQQSEGLAELKQQMAKKTSVFAGPSGVGKSSLINALMPKLALEIGGLSTKLGRGKHTTRHSEIFLLEQGGYCVDTPGFTSLETSAIPKNIMALLFKEFQQFAGECRFADCLHHHEIGCAVKEQIGKEVNAARYESYIKMLEGVSIRF